LYQPKGLYALVMQGVAWVHARRAS
jgi:hypothetical protein